MVEDQGYVGRYEFGAFVTEMRGSIASLATAVREQSHKQDEFIRDVQTYRQTPWRTLAVVVGLILGLVGAVAQPYISDLYDARDRLVEVERVIWMAQGAAQACGGSVRAH